MKKSIFVTLGIFSLVMAGVASFATKQYFEEVKADDSPVAVTLNFNSFDSESGDANVINLVFTPENTIPQGWDVAKITQVSRDAFWLNGVPTQDDGNAVIQKLTAYRYQLCIDAINWGKYHDLVKADDVVLIQGKWQAVHETTTYDVTVTPIYLQYTGSGWTRLDQYDFNLNFSIDQGRKTNKNELYLAPTAENPVPPNSGWSNRMDSSANDCLQLNDVAASKTSQIIKVLEYCYLVYLPDAGFAINTNDVVTLQGIYVYNTPLLSFHVHVTTITVQWSGTEWVDYVPSALDDSSADQLEAGSLLANIGKWNAEHTKQCVKNFDQDADSLVYKKDKNNHTGVYFTGSANQDGEFRVYFPDNSYESETKGYAMTQLTFDYIYENSNTVGANNRNPSLTQDGYFVSAAQNVTNNFTVQALLHNNSVNMYYDIEVELINDGQLHSATVNLAYGCVAGFGFKVWDFNGMFFMSNVHANYQTYNANLDAMYGLLKMYDNYNDSGYTDCTDFYAAAKAGYLALDADEKALFGTNAAYASAKARLAAWTNANGDVLDADAGTITAKAKMLQFGNVGNTNGIIIVLTSLSLILFGVVGVLLVTNKRRKEN